MAAFVAVIMIGLTGFVGLRAGDDRPTVSEYLAASSLADRDQIRIGVFDGRPLVSMLGPEGPTGFDIEIARYLANSLGFDEDHIKFVALEFADRVSALQQRRVDLVVADFSITGQRQQLIRFSGPYLLETLRMLVPVQHAGRQLNQLDPGGPGVCVLREQVIEQRLVALGFRPVEGRRPEDCVAGVKSGQYDAFISGSTLLASLQWQSQGTLAVVDLPFDGVDQVGIGSPLDDQYLQALVQHFLLLSYLDGKDGAWQKAFEKTLGRAGLSATQPDVEYTVNLLDDLPPATSPDGRPPGLPVGAGPSRSGRVPGARRTRLPRQRAAGSVAPRGRLLPRRPPVAPNEPAGPKPGFDPQGPWSLILAVPAAMSALHLWMQSGGDLQLTLLLVDSVNPISFFATMMLAALWQLAAAPILMVALGTIILTSATDDGDRAWLARRYLVARGATQLPRWVLWLSLGLALVSWPVLYLPWWGLAAFVTVVVPLFGERATRWARVAALAVVALLIPTMATATKYDDLFSILMLTAPAVLVLLGTGRPIRRAAVPAFGRLAMVLAVGLLAGGVYSIVTVPILPRTVLEVAGPDPDAANRRIGGHVMSHDDQSTTVLLERGKLETISNDSIRSQVTCLQVVRRTYQLEVWGIAADQSLLSRLARGQLPTAPQDPNCRILIQP